MAPYLTSQIILGNVTYNKVVTMYPQFKEEVNKLLVERGHSYLIEE